MIDPDLAMLPDPGGKRHVLPWIDLLVRIAGPATSAGVWKNVDAGLSGEGDVDLAAPRGEWGRILDRFRTWAAQAGLGPVVVCRHVPGTLVLAALDPSRRRFAHLDVRDVVRLRGAPILTARDLGPLMVMDERGFRRLPPGAEGILKLALVGSARGGRPRPEKLRDERVRELLNADPDGAEAASRLFGITSAALRRAAEAVAAGTWNRAAMLCVESRAFLLALFHPGALLDRGREREVKRSCPLLVAGIAHGRGIPRPTEEWLVEVDAYAEHDVFSSRPNAAEKGDSMTLTVDTGERQQARQRLTEADGHIIAIVGPDGVGKTTLIDKLLDEVFAGIDVVNVRSPGILPRRTRGQGIVTEPHKKPAYPRALSWMKTLYLFVDYLLGWIFKLAPHRRRGGWVVIQRGWWDMVVDPLRYRLDMSPGSMARLARLLPKPDLTLILEAPPEVVHARKQELPVKELERQMQAWRLWLPVGMPRMYLDATRSAEQVAWEASLVVERLAEERA